VDRPVAAPGRRHGFPCFDGLRAIAAVSVVLVHTAFPSGFTTRSRTWGAYTSRLEIGVAVFFLISGFLLYRPFVEAHLAGRSRPAFGPYMRRRVLRIVPAYWVALFFAAYVLHTVPPIHGARSAVVYFGFLQIYFRPYILGGISAAWTLCVEVSFYLFLPLYALGLAAWSGRRGRQGGPGDRLRCEILGLVGLFALSQLYKVAVYAEPSRPQTGAGTWLPAQLDLFAFGMALAVASAWWSEHGEEPAVLGSRLMPAAAWIGALGTFWLVSTHAGLPRLPLYQATFAQAEDRQLLYGLFALFLLLPAVFGPQERGPVRALLRWRPIVWTGLVSYGIYLWHEAWVTEMLRWLHRPLFTVSFVGLTVGVLALTLVTAAASYVLVERPSQRLGRLPRPRPAALRTAAAVEP
jgi:peptidoglycan/LPS O-acetylase OafA/YrhL